MARAIWSGSINFGLVNVPVKAFAAVRDHSVHFNQLEKGTGARIHYKKVSDKTGKEVDRDDIESGYEITSGNFVVFDPEELDKLRPRTTRTVDVTDFVNLDDVDPVYFDHTYWLAPDGEGAERAYRLLTSAMESEGKVGIGTVVMRNKQYLAAIRPLDGALALSTMRFADEVVPQSQIDALPGKGAKTKPDPRELKLASQIIESLTSDWDPKRYHDTYTEELKSLIEAKAKGKEIVVEEDAPAESNVLDLMAALEASLGAARKDGGRTTATSKAPAKRTQAKKAGARKATATKKSSSRKKASSARSKSA